MRQIVEQSGVMLEVDYELDGNEDMLGPNIKSVRVLDGNYTAAGPNLLGLLDVLFMLTSTTEGQPFLNVVAKELA